VVVTAGSGAGSPVSWSKSSGDVSGMGVYAGGEDFIVDIIGDDDD
jgi:hypothetical protein